MEVKVRNMLRHEFDKWLQISINTQAEYNASVSGKLVEDEITELKRILPSILPDGFDTNKHHFYAIDTEEDTNIGFIWIGPMPSLDKNSIFIFDIHIHEKERSKGIGRKALLQLHSIIANMGIKTVILNVLKSNYALKLYESVGYKVIENGEFSCIMSKTEVS